MKSEHSGLLLRGLLILLSAVAVRGQAPSSTSSAPLRSSEGATATQGPQRDRGAASIATARIRGRVVSADGGRALGRAVVRALAPELSGGRSTVADELGRYELSNLPAGRYTLTASKTGYLTWSYGQRRPREGARPITVALEDRLENIDVALPAGGVIVARVTDDVGDPISGARVTVLEYRFTAGQRKFLPVPTPPQLETNDQGELRIHGLPPGTYYVGASAAALTANLSTSSGLAFATTYYPGTLSLSEAQALTVNSAQETLVNFPLTMARPARITGTVRRSDGGPINGRLTLQVREASTGTSPTGAILLADGSFTIGRLTPGNYFLDARPTSVVTETEEFGTLSLVVTGDDIAGLVVNTRRGSVLRGRVTFDAGAPPAGLGPGSMQVTARSLNPVDAPLGRFQWRGDWTFEVVGVAGKRVVRPTALPQGWALKAVSQSGRDITDTPIDFDLESEIRNIELVLTNKHPDVSGVVLDERGAPVGDCTVVLFPENPDQWTSESLLFGTSRPDQQGRFRITSLTAGRYLAAAVDYVETGAERDPDLLNRLKGAAIAVALGDDETKSVSLRLQRQ